MSILDAALMALLAATVLYQAWVTVLVASAPEYDAKQKVWQIVLVWLVFPLLAAIVVHTMLWSERAGSQKRDTAFIRNDEGGGNNAG